MGSHCLTPFYVKNKDVGRDIPVPCGKCPNCVKRRVSGWSFRLMQEEKRSISAHFITLTYDTKHVPITQNGFMNLKKRDLQLFFKRLRKAHGKGHVKLAYYACGEYGTHTWRPHYHVILFNAKIELISPAWNLGHVHYGQVTCASVGYTLKYVSKLGRIPVHRNDDREREFPLMSKKLGDNYVTEAMKKYHLADLDNRMCCVLEDGKKIAMPRYYKEKIYDEDQRDRIAVVSRQRLQEELEKNLKKYGDRYWDMLESAKFAIFKKENLKSKNRQKL